MFAAQLLSIIGFAFALPFLPFYIRELGVTEERLVPVWAGIIAAASSLVMAFFSPLWGWLADRYGRKIMVERAMFGGAVLTFAMGLVTDVWQLLFLRLLSGATTGTTAASIALVSTVAPPKRLGYSLGIMQVAVFLGMTLGPWIGGLLADTVGYRVTFATGGVILILGGSLVLFGARERFSRPEKGTSGGGDRLLSLLAYAGFPAMMAMFFFFNFSLHFVMLRSCRSSSKRCATLRRAASPQRQGCCLQSAAARPRWPPAGSAISATGSATEGSCCSISC